MWDVLLLDCNAATMLGDAAFGAIRDAAIGIRDGRIAYIGPRSGSGPAQVKRSLGGAWVTPGLIDCHTHLVFAGNRASEWDARRRGMSYEEIARAGGGILSTVRATRAASEDELVAQAQPRLAALRAQGVTTVEIKSGYGLDTETELRLLRAAGRLAHDMRVSRTFLGAHALPPECALDRAGYVERVCDEMIPAVARERLADAVDVFCETIAFTPAETARIFAAARARGLGVKVHAEQLSNSGAAALAAECGALSADHLEHLDEAGISALAKAGSVAVMLPAAFYFLRESRKPPVAALRAAGVAMAVATDCNPGTSPCTSPLLVLNMACTLFDLTPEEALAGMTRNAARALGLALETGTLEVGKSADLAIWNVGEPAELAYWLGADLLRDRYFRGRSDNEDQP
ncbi:MAG: imidazolonepropionase [Alphaproteobacteria bacterium]|nr:imidazolonepropionase [Alphaproteobacteria bacterium]MBV9695229.1 imidazolonepropionase [Alphaproteobacteria bacterium]